MNLKNLDNISESRIIPFLIRDFSPIILLFLVIRPIAGMWTECRIGFVNIPVIMTIAVISMALFYLLSDKKEHGSKQLLHQDPVVILLLIYVFFNILSFTINPKVAVINSLSEVFRFLSFLAMYLLGMAFFKSHRKRDWIIASYIIAAIFIAVVGYYQWISGTFHTSRGVLAIQGTFAHPNMYGNFLNLVNLACIYFLMQKKFISLNIIILSSNLLLFSQTYSRMALAVWLLMILVLTLVYRKQSAYFLPCIIIVAVIIFYKFPYIIDFWSHRFSTIEDPAAAIGSRAKVFSALIYWFKQNPLIGIGPGTFCPYYFRQQPHNELLRNLAEVGLLGTIPLVFMWGIFLKRFSSFAYFLKRTAYDQQKFFIFLMIITVIITSLTANIGTQQELLWPLFLLFGGYTNRDDTMYTKKTIHHQPSRLNIP